MKQAQQKQKWVESKDKKAGWENGGASMEFCHTSLAGSEEICDQAKCRNVVRLKAELKESIKYFVLLDNCNLEYNLDLPFARTMA